MLRNPLLKLSLVPITIFSILLTGYDFKSGYGADTPDRVVDLYLLALEKKNEELMLKLVPRKYSAQEAAEDKIARFGGHKIQEYKVVYMKPKSVFLIANIKVFYTDRGVRKRFDDTLTIAYQGGSRLELSKGRWYLLMGKGNVPSPEVQPAEPKTSPPKKSP